MSTAKGNAVVSLFRPIAVESPLRLTDVSAWVEHIPFALNLVELIRPALIVELGTHAGDSYCAMCQAVARLGTSSRCYAVDTWHGDAHAGAYGDEIFEELRQYHDPLYGSFSRLVRSTFDDAAGHFPDGSVDLLHIDGFHSLEAVRHDFENWLPRLSPRAVVLFHDTNVREGGFGVWRLWTDVASRYRWSFEFPHGHGLGVLAPNDPPETLRPLFEALPGEAVELRDLYAKLGANVQRARQLRAAQLQIAQLNRDVAETARARGEAVAEAQLGAVEAKRVADEAQRLAAEAQRDVAEARRALAVSQRELAEAQRELAEAQRELAEAQRELAAARQRATAAEHDLDAARRDLAAARRDLAGITRSKAWRLVTAYRGARDGLLRRR